MRRMRETAVRTLGGIVATLALLAAVGSGLFHVGQALAGPGSRRAEMAAAGIDPMPVGTARQVDRVRQLRAQKP